jgi:Skp family chaperone for outer membrane proteins
MKKLAVVAVLMLGMSSVMAQKGGKPAPKVFHSIGYVYTDTLLSKMPSREDAMAKLKEFEANGYKELQEMEADYYKALNLYETGKATMTPFLIKNGRRKIAKERCCN